MPAKKKEVAVKELSPIDKLIKEYDDQKKRASERLNKLRAIQDDVQNFERKLKFLDKQISDANKKGLKTTTWSVSSSYGYFTNVDFGVRELEHFKEDLFREYQKANAFLAELVAKMNEPEVANG